MGRGLPAASSGDDHLKTSWPELVGKFALHAIVAIGKDRPDVEVEVHLVVDNVPPGYDDKRVRLFLDRSSYRIARTPVVG